MEIGRSYIGANPNNTGDRGRKGVKSDYLHIAVHYQGHCKPNGDEATAKDNCEYYRDCNTAGISANYVTDRDGAQMAVDPYGTRYGYHIGIGKNPPPGVAYCLDAKGIPYTNANTLGIEVGTCKMSTATLNADDRDWYFDPDTYKVTVELVRQLMAEFGISIDNVIRHYDANTIHKLCPSNFIGSDKKTYYGKTGEQLWAQFKADVTGGAVSPGNSQPITAPTHLHKHWVARVKTATDIKTAPNGASMAEHPRLGVTNLIDVYGQDLSGAHLYIRVCGKYYGWIPSAKVVENDTNAQNAQVQAITPRTSALNYVGEVCNLTKLPSGKMDVLNVRIAPRASATIMQVHKSLGLTNLVDVLGADATGAWLFINITGAKGWVSARYIKKH